MREEGAGGGGEGVKGAVGEFRFAVVTMEGRKVIEKERHEFGFGVF